MSRSAAFVLGWLFLALGTACAEGSHMELLQPADWKSLRAFFDLYVSREVGLVADMENELRFLKHRSKALRAWKRERDGADCKPDCDVLREADAQLARAEADMREARRIVRGNLRILLHNQGAATKGAASYMDALAAREKRKLGFDMGMIVAKTFQMDPGPLLAQLGKDLGLSDTVAGVSGDAASLAGDTARLYLLKGSKMTGDIKRSAFTAIAKATANKLFDQSGAKAQLVSSFVQNMTFGMWEAWNEAIKTAEESGVEGAKPVLTPGMVSMVVVQAMLGAAADARGKALAREVDEARRDEARAESMRLLAIAEYKAMAQLKRRLYQKNSALPAKGLAVDLNWERGRFRTAMNEICGSAAEMPRVADVSAGDQKEVVPARVALAQALAALRKANAMLEQEVARARDRECSRAHDERTRAQGRTVRKMSNLSDSGFCGLGGWRDVRVPGSAVPFFARVEDARVDRYGDEAASEGPAAIDILRGARKIELRISGGGGHPGGGDFMVTARKDYLRFGVGGVSAPINSLIGVFDVGKVWQPVALYHYRDGGKRVTLDIPAGATRLFFGVMDAYEWNNNTGEYHVQYRFIGNRRFTSPAGDWSSSEGAIHARLEGNRLYGPYEQDNGRILMTLKGRKAVGIWVEDDSNETCATMRDGSRHWGRAVLEFDECFEGFTGWWSYCDAPRAYKEWTGSR